MNFITIAGSAIAIAFCLLSSGCAPKNTASSPSDAPIEGAGNQAAAVRLAKNVDIPALEKADSVIIETAVWAGSKNLVVTDHETLTRIRAALVVSETPPSGGETWCTLTWQRNGEDIRKIWVYKYGEWGFDRPSVDWTTGTNPKLPKILRDLLSRQSQKPK